MKDQDRSLSLCREETKKQNEELRLKFVDRNKGHITLPRQKLYFAFEDLKIILDNADYVEKCKTVCDAKHSRYLQTDQQAQTRLRTYFYKFRSTEVHARDIKQ